MGRLKKKAFQPKPDWKRVTREPSLTYMEQTLTGFNLYSSKGKMLGKFRTERELKERAIQLAKQRWSLPQSYVDSHRARLAQWESLMKTEKDK